MFRVNRRLLQAASEVIASPLDAITTHPTKKQEILNMLKNHQPVKPLTKDQRAYFNRVIRVDQAGELGANYIYAGQFFILANKYPHLKPVLQHMWDQEIHHHSTFNKLQLKHGVRPSMITPIWTLGAFAMGAGTAFISPQAAMACTEAVETVIGGHYNDQLRVLNNFFKDKELIKGEGNYEINEIIETIKQFRDDELEHLDTAIKYDSKQAVPYMILTETIKMICRVAIFAAERV
ncbi:Catabolite repression protein cat5 [Hanseniaspora valbyensis]